MLCLVVSYRYLKLFIILFFKEKLFIILVGAMHLNSLTQVQIKIMSLI